MLESTEKFLSQVLCGFKKAHNTQKIPFQSYIKLGKRELNNGGFVDTILNICIPRDLLIANLEGFLLLDYLTNRKQRTKLGSSFSSLYNINTSYRKDQSLVLFFLIFS